MGLDVERPSAGSVTEQSSNIVRVAIGRGGEIAVDGRPTSPWRLESEIQSRIADYTDKSVLVVADQSTDAQTLVDVMDTCRKAGARDVAISVDAE